MKRTPFCLENALDTWLRWLPGIFSAGRNKFGEIQPDLERFEPAQQQPVPPRRFHAFSNEEKGGTLRLFSPFADKPVSALSVLIDPQGLRSFLSVIYGLSSRLVGRGVNQLF